MVSLNSLLITTLIVFGVFDNYTYAYIRDKWYHAVNSKAEQIKALKSDSTMIEANVILGEYYDESLQESKRISQIPIIGQPPAIISDLSLQQFLDEWSKENKTVILNFKSTEAFRKSIPIMNKSFKNFKPTNRPWLHADIIRDKGDVATVDDYNFIELTVKNFPDSMLSLGWTKGSGENLDDKYTWKNIKKMVERLDEMRKSTEKSINKTFHILEKMSTQRWFKHKQLVTFAVRALFEGNSVTEFMLKNLRMLDQLLGQSYELSLTVWCSDPGVVLNYSRLAQLVAPLGIGRVFLDLPEKMSEEFFREYNRQLHEKSQKSTKIIQKNHKGDKWYHAVNSKAEQIKALKSDSTMIEANVILGEYYDESLQESKRISQIPIIGQPPAIISDLSLQQFLDEWSKENKTVILNFKSTEAFRKSIPIMNKSFKNFTPTNQPWLHADILRDTGDEATVDDYIFIDLTVKNFPDSMLSLGWTKGSGENSDDKSTKKSINNTFDILEQMSNESWFKHKRLVTFTVRALFKGNSVTEFMLKNLRMLDQTLGQSYELSLTVWCSDPGDVMNYSRLVELVAPLGISRVFLDLPDKMSEEFFREYDRQLKIHKGDKWYHAVNSKAEQIKALESDSTMIEADVILGEYYDESVGKGESFSQIPIMGQPPAINSDLSLQEFLDEWSEKKNKTVKLDFKSIEAFTTAIPIMEESFKNFKPTNQLWLHADIIRDKGDLGTVDLETFIGHTVKNFPDSMLSLGWTKGSGENSDNKSTQKSINNTFHILQKMSTQRWFKHKQRVTLAVRASFKGNSVTEFMLKNLRMLDQLLGQSYELSLTVWCSDPGDVMNYSQLVELVALHGIFRVFLDLPEKISEEFFREYDRQPDEK